MTTLVFWGALLWKTRRKEKHPLHEGMRVSLCTPGLYPMLLGSICGYRLWGTGFRH